MTDKEFIRKLSYILAEHYPDGSDIQSRRIVRRVYLLTDKHRGITRDHYEQMLRELQAENPSL